MSRNSIPFDFISLINSKIAYFDALSFKKHRLCRVEFTNTNSVNTPDENFLIPDLDTVGIARLMKFDIAINHLRCNPGTIRVSFIELVVFGTFENDVFKVLIVSASKRCFFRNLWRVLLIFKSSQKARLEDLEKTMSLVD